MAEHQIVDLAVEGSNPSSHPNLSIRFVYTERVDDRPIVWDAANRRHLGSDHPERRISIDEIEEVLRDVDRIEVELTDDKRIRSSARPRRALACGDLDR